ncbi:MAG TPA: hypothetical protein ENI42_03885 [Thermoplasmatales archaeon]|nr:hypothetical protein [Thermoplasmatales archaeon]
MKMKTLVATVSSLTVFIVLTGCISNESWVTGDTSMVEITEWGIVTERFNLTEGWEKVGNGFIHLKDESIRFIVGGHAKNIAGRDLKRVEITVRFYNGEGDYLGSLLDTRLSVKKGEVFPFYVYVNSFLGYFDEIEDVKFRIKAQ